MTARTRKGRVADQKADQPGPRFINRDLSWLEFNSRVLDEAADKGNPLLERLKFVAIFSSNLDEFCMVRVAAIAQQVSDGWQKVWNDYGYDPEKLLSELDARVRSLTALQCRILNGALLPALAGKGMRILRWKELSKAQRDSAERTMASEIMPVLTPIGVDHAHPFPLIPNLSLELLIRLVKEGSSKELFAVLEIPSVLPRFIRLPSESRSETHFIAAEELISNNLKLIFPGCSVRECAAFRITRDMDFSIDEESIADLLSEMQIALQRKARRRIIRLELSKGISKKSKEWLVSKLRLGATTMIHDSDCMLNPKALFQLTSLKEFPDLRDKPLPPLPCTRLDVSKGVFASIRSSGAFIVHHPYESFDPVVRMLEEAAEDTDVLAIKQTLYRVGGDSPVVKSLIKAARNGKQVSVLVELKARFDEENNINWAMELAEAGAHVVYGIAGLKVHCKALLVVRREEGAIRRYVHLSTGNYNDRTAKQYTDIGYFSDDKLLATDVSSLFNVITGFSSPPVWNKLIVAPFNLRERLLFLIRRETALSTPQNPGHIVAKMNSLIDYELMDALYEAAAKNVRIDLAVRGICGLNPFFLPAEQAANITVVSVLDRFLEHSRIYCFANNGSPEYYMGSSDMMPRNLRRRIEILFPVDEEEIRKELDMVLAAAFSDRRKGRRLIAPGRYSKPSCLARVEKTRSQLSLYEFYKARLEAEAERVKAGRRISGMPVFKSPESSKPSRRR